MERPLDMKPVGYNSLPRNVPAHGIYLFSDGTDHLYVGRSNNMQQRFSQHCRPGSQHNQAVFAFKIARRQTGKNLAAYTQGVDSRKGLVLDPVFSSAFSEAKGYLRKIDIRHVEETDPRKQALLEIYRVIALNCSYNDFDTH